MGVAWGLLKLNEVSMRRPTFADIESLDQLVERYAIPIHASTAWAEAAHYPFCTEIAFYGKQDFTGYSPQVGYLLIAGWPMDALSGGFTCDDTRLPTPVRCDDYHLLLPRSVMLPLRPIWPGFAINTAFHAGLLRLLIPVPFALRKHIRRKRGLCVKCGYDLKGAEHEACPECGAKGAIA